MTLRYMDTESSYLPERVFNTTLGQHDVAVTAY